MLSAKSIAAYNPMCMGRGTSRLILWLGCLFAVQSVGFVALVWRQGTPVANWAFSARLLSDEWIAYLDRGAALLVMLAAIVMLVAPSRRITVAAGVVASLWMATVSGVDSVVGGHFAAELAPAAHAVRWATPAVVAALAAGLSDDHALRGLRLAAGAVFVAHGIECLLAHPTFIDFLISVPQRVFRLVFDQSGATRTLLIIGVVDVVVGMALVVGGWWQVAFWMAMWGFLTAAVRVLYFGEAGWPDALIRVTNGGIPLVIGICRWSSRPMRS